MNTRKGMVPATLLATLFFAFALMARAQTLVPIETRDNVLLLTTDSENRLLVEYFGKKLGTAAEYGAIKKQIRLTDGNAGIYNSAYTPSGSWSTTEPAIQVTHSDGNTSLELKYISHEVIKTDENVACRRIREST